MYRFGLKHKLSLSHRGTLLEIICKVLECQRSKAIVWSTHVTRSDKLIGNFVIYEDEEPVDAAYKFVSQHNLTLGYRHAILSEACDAVECHRLQPGKGCIMKTCERKRFSVHSLHQCCGFLLV